MGDSTKPYISFVIAGRNDDYGGDFNYRLNNSINFLSRYVEQYKLPAEYIVVNYNPIDDKPPLREAIDWPKDRKYLKIRIITVPKEVHESLRNPEVRDPVPLYEYIAKNTGIRRANGEFICGANPDIIYHPKIIKSLSKRNLKKGYYYRVDRCDFHKIDFGNGRLPDDLIKQLKKSTFRVFLKGNTYVKSFPNLFDLRLWDLRRKNEKDLKERNENSENTPPPEYFYHCNCSGDFMMMHKDHWYELNAHPENTLVAAHTDALFVIMAAAHGLREYVYKWPLFHQNHERRYECDGEEVKPSVLVMYDRYVEAGNKMLKEGKPIIANDENWGLSNNDFEDVEF